MPYLRCGRCGLQIKIRASFLKMDHCPRCLARNAIATPLVLSAEPVTTAVGWGSSPNDNASSDPAVGTMTPR